MRFAQEHFLYLSALSLLLLGLFAWGALRLQRARSAFGEEGRILALVSNRTLFRRSLKAILSSSAVLFAFLAASEPEYGKGTRILPATNLDVAIVLDYSKSMYARDVAPYRMSRAKTEVLRLIDRLSGARFGAVAFAGEPLAYPLTSDAAAIKQFLRSFDPNDMAVGGTAIARALDSAKDLLLRDPRSTTHEKLIVLVTDGEDLEGDPVAVAETAKAAGIRVYVVQIGGKSPEPIPDIDESGKMRGYRKNAQGELLTTALSTEGETQLRSVAEKTGGTLTLAEKGEVGVDKLSEELRRHMTEELSERVETVYADVYQYPLAVAVLLLLVEAFIGTAPKSSPPPAAPKGERKRRKPRRYAVGAVGLTALFVGTACEPVDHLFTRESPTVRSAIAELSEKRAEQATQILTSYLETGKCENGILGAGEKAQKYADAAFDLALALGAQEPEVRAGDAPALTAPPAAGSSGAPQTGAPSASPSAPPQGGAGLVDCALQLLARVADNASNDVALRARALYLMGNLEMKRNKHREAVKNFDRALLLAPGSENKAHDSIGLNIAHNRALALRLAEEEDKKKDEEKKNEKSDSDKNDDQKKDGDKKDESQPQDEKKDESKQEDQKKDDQKPHQPEPQNGDKKDEGDEKKPAGSDKNDEAKNEPQKPEPQSGDEKGNADPSSKPQEHSASQDQRLLDLLEQAPTLQEQEAKNRAQVRGRRTMEDK